MILMLTVTVLCVLIAQPADAYVGPGLGAGSIATLLGLLGSIFLALFAVIYYPIKRAMKKWKAKKAMTSEVRKK